MSTNVARWVDRDWRDVPGPYFTVGAWVLDVPTTNLARRSNGHVFIWRQPRDVNEHRIVTVAFGGHGRRELGDDGDAHWSLDAIRAWWAGREALAREYRAAGIPDVAAYFAHELPAYLQRYAFRLEHGRLPGSDDALPDLDAPPRLDIGSGTAEFDGALELFARQRELVNARVPPGTLPLWGHARELGALNVPGVFAIAQTAPSSSHAWAPMNLCAGDHGAFVARQPRSADELERVLDAATTEPLFGMLVDAWTAPEQIRTWWRTSRGDFERALRAADLPDLDVYLRELPDYLCGLIFLIEEGRLPARGDELPALDDVTPERYWQTPRGDQLPFAVPRLLEGFNNRRFERRHPHNVPGPFYGADSDTCGTGPIEAPSSVACDGEYGQEFVYRQPRTAREVARIERAALVETFDGHACDGNDHWTPELVRAWWAEREAHRDAWRAADVPYVDELFERELPRYLRGYLFFLEKRRAPSPSDALPAL